MAYKNTSVAGANGLPGANGPRPPRCRLTLTAYLDEVARKKSRRSAERALSAISRKHIALFPGQSGKSPYVPELIGNIEARDFIGDKAYDSDKLLEFVGSRGRNAVIPPK